MEASEYIYPRYLAAKKAVDDRALNMRVFQQVTSFLAEERKETLYILEIAAGIGTMIPRILSHPLAGNIYYHAIDISPENISSARQYLQAWASKNCEDFWHSDEGELILRINAAEITVNLECADIFSWIVEKANRRQWDLLIANAFLDLIDIHRQLPQLAGLLKPAGAFYFTINFDGETIFQPVSDPVFEKKLMDAYHETMDARITAGMPSGDSRTGRRLFTALPAAGFGILDAGSSDWVVFPKEGNYHAEEGYFLHFIVQTVMQALKNASAVDADHLEKWGRERHQQIKNGQLIYIAHQLDFYGKRIR